MKDIKILKSKIEAQLINLKGAPASMYIGNVNYYFKYRTGDENKLLGNLGAKNFEHTISNEIRCAAMYSLNGRKDFFKWNRFYF